MPMTNILSGRGIGYQDFGKYSPVSQSFFSYCWFRLILHFRDDDRWVNESVTYVRVPDGLLWTIKLSIHSTKMGVFLSSAASNDPLECKVVGLVILQHNEIKEELCNLASKALAPQQFALNR
jgi:hypothetical protein